MTENIPLIPGTYTLRCAIMGSYSGPHDQLYDKLREMVNSGTHNAGDSCTVEFMNEGFCYTVNPLNTLGAALTYFKQLTEIWS